MRLWTASVGRSSWLGCHRLMCQNNYYQSYDATLGGFRNLGRCQIFCSPTSCLIALRPGLSLNLVQSWWPANPSIWIYGTSCWVYQHAWPHVTFSWVLGILTQVLMLVQQLFLPTEPSLQPKITLLSLCVYNASVCCDSSKQRYPRVSCSFTRNIE